MSENTVRIQDNLYEYVNGEWIANAVIPDDKPMCGGFTDLDTAVEKLMTSDINKMCEDSSLIENDNIRRAVALYKIAKNVTKRNKDGIKPVLKVVNKINKIEDISSFNRNLKSLVLAGIPLPFVLDVDQDMKNTDRHTIFVGGPKAILPDVTYYKPGMEQQKQALLGVWADMAQKLLAHTKLTEQEVGEYIQDTLKFDAIIAGLVKSNEEWSEYTKMYNPTKTRTLSSLLKPVKFRKLLNDLFGEDIPDEIIVTEPRFFKGFSTLFNEENFVLYKHWAYVLTVVEAAPVLSEKLREIAFQYSRCLSGVKTVSSIEKQSYQLTSRTFAEPWGLYYGQKYFGEEAKNDVISMVKEIIETYKERIAKNDFLSEATKQKAIVKLEKMVVKMGYPDSCNELYSKFVFDEQGSLYDALNTISAVKRQHTFDLLHKPVNRTQWVMPAHMVNACYNPFTNDITFPAAILQEPFYSIKQSRSKNLGGIGAVIGHEISHAFDNNGAQCDENGNLNNWWTKEDFKKFEQKTKAMIKEFEGIELPWGKVNASFIVSENIADNGGMAVTLNIMSKMDGANYVDYFENWAKVWCVKARPEIQQLLLSIDVHAPAILRANMQPRNFDEWYSTFNVKKSDKMYIAPTKRVVIW